MRYNLNVPTRVEMGVGLTSEIGNILKEYNINKLLMVYDQGIKATGIADTVYAPIKEAGIDVVIYDQVQADAPQTQIEEAGALAVAENIDGILGVGGGSTLDTCKAINILAGGNPAPLDQYTGEEVPKKPGKPMFLIPTTAGTGAEVSRISCYTNAENGLKLPIISSICTVPTVAILDPELTRGLPPGLTASTGFDTLAHCVEALTTVNYNPITNPWGKEAIRLIAKYLERAVKNGKEDMEAREGMQLAALIAALSFAHTGCHLGHGIGTPFGGRFHINHGTACGLFLPVAIEYTAPAQPDRVREVAELFGVDIPADATPEEVGKLTADAFRALRSAINFPTLKELGIKEEDLPVITEDGMNEFLSKLQPRELDYDALFELIKKEYDEN